MRATSILRAWRRSPKNRASKASKRHGASAGTPTASTGSTARSRATDVFSIDTPPPDRERLAARRVTCSLHPHRHRRPLPAHARPRGLLPDGLGRQRPGHRAAGAELLRRSLRSAAAVRRRRLRVPAKAGNLPSSHREMPISRRRLRRAVRAARRRGRGEVRGAVARARPLGRLVVHVHHDRRRVRSARAQRAFLRNLARGEAYQAEAPTLWDVDDQTAVAQAELEDQEIPGAYHRLAFHRTRRRGDVIDRDHASRAARRVRRARRPSRRRALRAAVRHRGDARRCSASRCRCSRTASPTPRRGPASR